LLQSTSLPSSICAGQQIVLPFTTTGSFIVGNQFAAQLSGTDGSFNTPTTIGTIAGTDNGSVTATIPEGTLPGTGYRIRIVSSQPASTGSSTVASIAIYAKPSATLSPTGTVDGAAGTTTTLTASPVSGVSYKWLKDETVIANATEQAYSTTEAGAYRVVVTTPAGCADTSAATVITRVVCVPLQVFVNSTDATIFTASVDGGIAPYQYSLDNIHFQNNNTFSNLSTGRDYTVYVKDAFNCTGNTSFTLRNPADYEPQVAAHVKSVVYGHQMLGAEAGTAVVVFDMKTQPKQMDIFYKGVQVASTGTAVSGKGWLSFPYNRLTGDPEYVTVRIDAAGDGDEWWYQAQRPVPDALLAGNTNQTVCAAVYVSPNFPTCSVPNNSFVQTISPAQPNAKLRATFRTIMPGNGTLYVYDGNNINAPLLGQYTGDDSNAAHPSITATNTQGRLTFRFIPGETGSDIGWIADLVCDESTLSQTITFDAVSDKNFGDEPFSLTASASSGLLVSFQILSGPATLSRNQVTLTGAGTVTVMATQIGSATYATAAPVQRTINVAKASQSISFEAPAAKVFGDAPFTINATVSSSLPINLRIVSGPASLDGNMVTITGAGTVRIEALQGGNENYLEVVVVHELTISRAAQAISFTAIPDKTTADVPFVPQAIASSTLPVSFQVISGPATWNGSTIAIIGLGEVVLEATQEGNADYLPADAARRSFTVSAAPKQTQTITFPTVNSKTFGDAPFALAATASSELPVTYMVISGPATIARNAVTITGAGVVTVEARQTGDVTYQSAVSVQQNITINKAAQLISFPVPAGKVLGDTPFSVSANATSGLNVDFRIISGPAVLNGTEITINGTGTVVVEASQDGNANYAAATPVIQSINVAKAAQAIAFGALPSKRVGEPAFAISATSTANLPVFFAVVSGPATISGNIVTLTGAGMVTIEARQAGNQNYLAAPAVSQSFNVSSLSKTPQTITFGTLGYKTYISPAFELTAIASSGLPVVYRVVSGPAKITSTTVSITGVGSVSIEASQPGNANFNAATPVLRSFTVGKGSQSITFNPPAAKAAGDPPFTISASATSGLTVNFRVVSGPATLSGNTVTLLGTGNVTIQASQTGNENFNAAVAVNRNISVTLGGSPIVVRQQQSITFNPLSNRTFGDASFSLSASSTSGLPVSFRVANGPATIWENTVTLSGAGNVTIEAYQDGNSSVQLATPIQQSFQVAKSNQSIFFTGPSSKVSTDPPFLLTATTSSGLRGKLPGCFRPCNRLGQYCLINR
jgi:hypothetical protein